MYSWLAPFIVLVVVLFLYYFGSSEAGGTKQAIRRDINFYMVAILGVAVVSIIASLRLEQDWLDMAAWVMGAVASVAVVWRAKTASPSPNPNPETRGPLESQDDQSRTDRGQ